MSVNKEYDAIIGGSGLSGLTSAYYLKKMNPEWKILIIERAGRPGGLTGNWFDHRENPIAEKLKLQTPMHMVFRNKYPNLVNLVTEISGRLSPLYKGYDIITSDGTRHKLEMNDWTARNLPAPFHGLGMFMKLKMPLLAKWDLMKLALVSSYCAKELMNGKQEPKLIPNTLSMESLEILLNVGQYTRDFIETVTPSIFNLHPWYTAAPRMAAVIAGTMMLERNSLHYHVFGKNYNDAFIDDFVSKLKEMGLHFKFFTEIKKIQSNENGSEVENIWINSFGPENKESTRYICNNCGAENYCLDRAFCAHCGLDTSLDKIRDGLIKFPQGNDAWKDPEKSGYENIKTPILITAMYPHMIARLIPIDSPLRSHPYVRSFFSSRGNRTQLSIARVYYKKQVTQDQRFITGTHNHTLCFNGCQSVRNNFGFEDLYVPEEKDVVDVLMDVGIIRDAHSRQNHIKRIVRDLNKVYPEADPSLVEHVSFANIYPNALYLSDQPSIAGLHRIYNTHRTGAKNWYVAGCHSGLIGIGMESAVESAMSTVNCIQEDNRSKEKVKIKPYNISAGTKLAAITGSLLLRWKSRFHNINRLSGNRYS
ncbi:MAG: FAD-dependent oxidoreductase [Pseudomonadota bacterium]